MTRSQLDAAKAGAARRGPESGPLRVFAAGTPIEQRKLRNVLNKLGGSLLSGPSPLFLSQKEDVDRAGSNPDALVLVFHAPSLAGFSRLAIDGVDADAEGPEATYVLTSSVTVYIHHMSQAAGLPCEEMQERRKNLLQ